MRQIKCHRCEELHDIDDMDIGFMRPDEFLRVPKEEREQRCKSTDDVCTIDDSDFYLRGILPVPVMDGQEFAWGVWARVSEEDFKRYLELWDDELQGREPPFAGEIANSIPGYDETIGVSVSIQLIGASSRPTFTVNDKQHRLFGDQQKGVSYDRVLEFLDRFLH
jgi:hypothetical protein